MAETPSSQACEDHDPQRQGLPVDGAAVDERGEETAPGTEGLPNRAHGQHNVQVVAHAANEGRVTSILNVQGGTVSMPSVNGKVWAGARHQMTGALHFLLNTSGYLAVGRHRAGAFWMAYLSHGKTRPSVLSLYSKAKIDGSRPLAALTFVGLPPLAMTHSRMSVHTRSFSSCSGTNRQEGATWQTGSSTGKRRRGDVEH